MVRQALILAGGLGTRLGSITRDIPKPMVPVGDRPFLEWLIRMFSAYGIRRYVLCVGYLAPVIQDHFKNGDEFGCQIDYSVEEELLGTGGAIKKASSLLDDEFFVLSGDNFLKLDYRAYLEHFENTPQAAGMMVCWNNDPPLFRKNLRVDDTDGKVLDYDFHSDKDKNYVDIGVKLFRKEMLKYFPEEERFSLEEKVLPRLAKDGKLYAYPVDHPNLDVGTPEGLENVRKELLNS